MGEAGLEGFAAGNTEVCAEETIAGRRYLRLMRPLVIDKSCLTCHAEQGYKVGDLRGGLSVSVPMDSVWGDANAERYSPHRRLRGDVASGSVGHRPDVAQAATADVASL